MVTELSWPSAAGHILPQDRGGYEVTPRQQGQRLTSALRLLVPRRVRLGLTQVFWYTWLSRDTTNDAPFEYAGLRRIDPSGRIFPKPAQAVFRADALAIEGCAKRRVATRCG